MTRPLQTDVVIAGAGVAGASAAAALSEFGYQVLVAEPGLDFSRRLAGELIHPPGKSALAELGLLRFMEEAGGVGSLGFAVFPRAFDVPCAAGESNRACLLPYAEIAGPD